LLLFSFGGYGLALAALALMTATHLEACYARKAVFCHSGILRAVDEFSAGGAGRTILGVFVLLIALGFGAVAVLDVLMITKIHRIYRSSGASMAKAHQEFTTNIMKSDAVRNLATEAGTAAVRNQFNRY